MSPMFQFMYLIQAGILDEQVHSAVRSITVEMGEFYQIEVRSQTF